MDRIGVNNLLAKLLIEYLKYVNDNMQDYVVNPGLKSPDLGTTWKNFDLRVTTLSENSEEAEVILEFNTKFDETRNAQWAKDQT